LFHLCITVQALLKRSSLKLALNERDDGFQRRRHGRE